MKGLWKRTLPVHPDLEGFQTLDMGERKEIIPERPSINPPGGLFDPIEEIGWFSELNKMSEMIFLGPTGKADIDLDDVKFILGCDEEIDSKIHERKRGLPPFMGGSPDEALTGSFAFAGG